MIVRALIAGRRLVCFALTLLVLSGCAEDVTEYPFRDERGRECVYTCGDRDCTFDCDGESSRECSGGPLPRPCLTIAVAHDSEPGPQTGTGSLCDSCCAEEGGPSTWVDEDCSALVCTTASDCLQVLWPGLRCEDGHCVENLICVADPPPGEPLCDYAE